MVQHLKFTQVKNQQTQDILVNTKNGFNETTKALPADIATLNTEYRKLQYEY